MYLTLALKGVRALTQTAGITHTHLLPIIDAQVPSQCQDDETRFKCVRFQTY
jgi:hypothetical protein